MKLFGCPCRGSLLLRLGGQLRIRLQVGDRLRSGAHAGTQLVGRDPSSSTSSHQEVSTHAGTGQHLIVRSKRSNGQDADSDDSDATDEPEGSSENSVDNTQSHL